MNVKQIYQIVNDATKMAIGETAVLAEDLSNLVDVGNALFNANAVDNYVKALVDRIGKVVFVERKYTGHAPSVFMDSWEFGSVVEKIRGDLPDATENESWELQDGASYDPNIFYQPKIAVKFFNSKTTFEVPVSFTTKQVRESFTSAEQLNSLLSMIMNEVEKKLTVAYEQLIMRTIDSAIADTVYDDYQGAAITSSSGVKAINLLYLYNQTLATPITAAQAIKDKEFLRFAAYQIKLYTSRIGSLSKLFNVGKTAKFTPRDLLKIVMLAEFKAGADVYLQSDTFHDELVKMPAAEEVPYWQGSGTDYGFSSTSKVDVTSGSGHAQTVTGVLCVMFDRDALGVTQIDRRVTQNFNAKAEFYTNFNKSDAAYFNDLDENFIVFFAA